MQVKVPSGMRGIDLPQVVLGGAVQGQPAPLLGLAPGKRHRDHAAADQILAGQALGGRHDLLGRPLGDHDAAVHARTRPHVDDVIGGTDRLLVVLDHDHRVAEIAQILERLEQALVVALVQPDRGLVEDVEHAGEARADLRGEPDALALAAGQAAGIAGERQVAEADIAQEAEPVVDLLEDAPRDLLMLGAKMRGQRLNQAAAASIARSVTSPMWRPWILTASASGFSR